MQPTQRASLPPWLPEAPSPRAHPVPSWIAPRGTGAQTSAAGQTHAPPGLDARAAAQPPWSASVLPPTPGSSSALQQALASAIGFNVLDPDGAHPAAENDQDAPVSSVAGARAVQGILPDALAADDDDEASAHHDGPVSDAAFAALQAENTALRAQLAELTVVLGRTRREVLARSEGELVRLSLAIAERVVRRELATDPGLVARWAREAVEALTSRDDLVVAVSPDLANALPADVWARALAVPFRLEVDPSLGTARCEVRAGAAIVDASADGRMAAVRAELAECGE